MERIKSIQQLKMQKDLLQLQQMIAELRMKKDLQEIRSRAGLTKKITPTVGGLLKAGMRSGIGKQVMVITAGKLARRIFRKKQKHT